MTNKLPETTATKHQHQGIDTLDLSDQESTTKKTILQLTMEAYFTAIDNIIKSMDGVIRNNPQITAQELLNIARDSANERKKENNYNQ